MRKTYTPDIFIAALFASMLIAMWFVMRAPIIIY